MTTQLAAADLEYAVQAAQRTLQSGMQANCLALLEEDSLQTAAVRQALAVFIGAYKVVKEHLSKQNHYPTGFLNAYGCTVGAELGQKIVQPYARQVDAADLAVDFNTSETMLVPALASAAFSMLRKGVTGITLASYASAYLSGLKHAADDTLQKKYTPQLKETKENSITLQLPEKLAQIYRCERITLNGKIMFTDTVQTSPVIPAMTFADIGGYTDAKSLLENSIKNFHARELRNLWGLPIQKNFLLCGPPGTGKTIFAYAYAHAVSLPANKIDMTKIYDPYIGKAERNLREELAGPQVAVIDELDSLLRRKSSLDNQVYTNIVNLFAVIMDERKEDDDFHLMATVNNLSMIDDKMQRAGRFAVIPIGYPTPEDMKEVFSVHLKKRTTHEIFRGSEEQLLQSIPTDKIVSAIAARSQELEAMQLPGIVGADIELIVYNTFEARFRAHRDGGKAAYPTLQEVLKQIRQYKTRQMTE